jgi:predicted nuclease with TOPRIM domain
MKSNIILKALTIAFFVGFLSLLFVTKHEAKELQSKIDSLNVEVSTLNELIDVRDEEIEVLKDLVDSDFDRMNEVERLDKLRQK